MQLQKVTFDHFKALCSTTLNLGQLTLVVGANGSGKSTALAAIKLACEVIASGGQLHPNEAKRLKYVGGSKAPSVGLAFANGVRLEFELSWDLNAIRNFGGVTANPYNLDQARQEVTPFCKRVRVLALDARAMMAHVQLNPGAELAENGAGLATVLDQLRDGHPERFERLNQEWGRWLPEYDRILFDTPGVGSRSIRLRTREGGHSIAAEELSQGTLLALGFLTMAYLPSPPSLLCVEEPDRGVHPRLLRHVQDALYRLAYPKDFGEERPPVQIVATTQSPYFLDLFREHPEEIVVAQKCGLVATFEKLSDRQDIDEILTGASLGEVWYSGVLGGVPSAS